MKTTYSTPYGNVGNLKDVKKGEMWLKEVLKSERDRGVKTGLIVGVLVASFIFLFVIFILFIIIR
jgi:hypothetical protein